MDSDETESLRILGDNKGYKAEIEENREKVLKEITKAIDGCDVGLATDWLFVLDKLERELGR